MVNALKRAEHEDYYDRNTDFSPFSLNTRLARDEIRPRRYSSTSFDNPRRRRMRRKRPSASS